MHFKTLVENQLGTKIKAFQSDGGKEYAPITKYLSSQGIVHRFSCPYTHEQNGMAERKHGHITELGLALLANASMPLKYWGEAFQTVIYIINRLPTPTLNNANPLETLFHITPDYSLLRVFGCSCFPYLRPYNRNQFQYRSQQCVFLGYSVAHKGYLCLTNTGRLYISRHVQFDEHVFPFKCNPNFASTNMLAPPSPLICVPSIPTLPCTNIFTPLSTPLDQSLDTVATPSSSSKFTEHVMARSAAPDISSPQHTFSAQHNPVPHSAVHTESDSSVSHNPTPPIVHIGPESSASPQADAVTNLHPMRTRSKSGIFKPKVLLAASSCNTDHNAEPKSVKSALKSPYWKSAMGQEYSALMQTKTWNLVPLPHGRNPIGCKWVFRLKHNPDGTISKHKARLVAKGFHQQEGFDFFETFSPVVKPTTVRVVLTLALSQNWFIKQIDINNAFLNGDLSEEVYMTQPPSFVQGDGSLVCKLNKALYGLKQVPQSMVPKTPLLPQ